MFKILREIAMVQAACESTVMNSTIAELKSGKMKRTLSQVVSAFQEKYNLSESEAIQIGLNKLTIGEIATLLESRNQLPVMPADEKAADAFSSWCHDKSRRCEVLHDECRDNGEEHKAWKFKGMSDAYHDASCMFDVLTTRSKRLPPEIKPYLSKM